jgi:hypothetical protein
MNYFHSKRKHYRLSELSDATFAVAVFDTSVFFIKFVNIKSMYDWYSTVPNKCCHEVIRTPSRKLVLDIDGECNIDIILKCLKKLLGEDASIATYHSHGPAKTSWHLVVTNLYFEDHHHCKYIASLIADYSKNIDMAVYSGVQFLRMEGSHKNGRTKLRTGHHALSPYATFKEGVVSCIDNCRRVTMKIPKMPTFVNKNVNYDATAFKIRSKRGGITYLDRIRPSHCNLCNRVHDHENIAITDAGRIICWRNK